MIKVPEEDKSYYFAFLESLDDVANPEFPRKSWTDSEERKLMRKFVRILSGIKLEGMQRAFMMS
ncbi:MAG: hypothetical protein KFB93_08040 [Simkaniaceae bacterium]|jgi:hypothetical protein|nr:MAG: hypothetical protein KFB93_08040 [Simkaniaceae bacterium]